MKVVHLLLLLLSTLTSVTKGNEQARSINFVNSSGRRLEVHWIHPQTKERLLQGTVYNGSTFNLNSFVGHEFEIREMPGKTSGRCGDGDEEEECRVNFVEVTANQEQNVFITKGMQLKFVDDMIQAEQGSQDIVAFCEENARKRFEEVYKNSTMLDQVVSDMAFCIQDGVTAKLKEAAEEVSFQTTIRKSMGSLLENYTCADEEIESSKPINEHPEYWFDKTTKSHYTFSKFLDRAHAKIHVIKNFISREECDAMEQAAERKLHRATVADSDGGSRFSESRKAMQAGIAVPWEEEKNGHPIAVLSRRVFDYTNFATGLQLQEHGQEDLMSIQYFGKNYENGEEPDRYTPHCDGDCTGLPHRIGTRVATMVMYCDVPEKGGFTQFRNAGIRVKPEFGSATFFSYIGSDGIMDDGLTEHSGCPVFKGDKRIVTQWMRLGVDAENPWDSWNTAGVKHSEAELE